MLNPGNIKALIDLLATQPKHEGELKKQLAQIIKQQPADFKSVVASSYAGGLPAPVSQVLEALRVEGFKEKFDNYFKLPNPSLLDGVILLNLLLDQTANDALTRAAFNALGKQIALTPDISFDIFHKAEVFQNFFFAEHAFSLETLSSDDKPLRLYDCLTTRRATSFMLGVIYTLLARALNINADLCQNNGRGVVRFSDSFSAEPVYIDIAARGQFVSEEDCHSYAMRRGAQFDPKTIIPMDNKQIIKRLMGNIIFVCARAQTKRDIADLLRGYIK